MSGHVMALLPAIDVPSSPFSLQQHHLLEATMSPSLVNIACRTVQTAFAPPTKTTYAAGILYFNKFCNLWNVDKEAHMPASPTLLAAFVSLVQGHYQAE